MFTRTRLFITLTALFCVAAPPAGSAASLPDRSDLVVVVGMSPAEEAMSRHAVALFAEAGLSLPPLTIRRHPDKSGCNGYEGLHRTKGPRSMIEICTTDSEGWEQRTILHELGHAWSTNFLTAEHRALFQQERGWTWWLNYEHANWEDNGGEQAAEIIAWAVNDQAMPVLKIGQNSCADLHASYVALTGLEPLNGRTDRCQSTTTAVRT